MGYEFSVIASYAQKCITCLTVEGVDHSVFAKVVVGSVAKPCEM